LASAVVTSASFSIFLKNDKEEKIQNGIYKYNI
jgi:hypothetical protein